MDARHFVLIWPTVCGRRHSLVCPAGRVHSQRENEEIKSDEQIFAERRK